jgi:hypothetical protein
VKAHDEHFENKGLDKDLKTCTFCGGHYFVAEVHSCVTYLTQLLKEIVGTTAFDQAKNRMRNDSVYEASKLNEPNLDLSHVTDASSKLDAML